jgi:hypothetical protein
MSGKISIKNGKKGGRPVYGENLRIDIPSVEFVILTPSQYETLLEKYGYKLLVTALSILENWLKSNPNGLKYRGKNNYGHFRADGWVINSARQEL